MVSFQRVVPVLAVTDVERSIGRYAKVLGFKPDPFPATPPYSFAILRRDDAEIMLRLAPSARRPSTKKTIETEVDWAVYLRTGGDLLEFAEPVGQATPVLRGPERMFYGLVEFEVADPDGYRVCLSGEVPANGNVPSAMERERAGS
jgi:catechol 2,3-dioxygenase-like lactoylglutathione lyase family enzyme